VLFLTLEYYAVVAGDVCEIRGVVVRELETEVVDKDMPFDPLQHNLCPHSQAVATRNQDR
jgi:hypothetical protein